MILADWPGLSQSLACQPQRQLFPGHNTEVTPWGMTSGGGKGPITGLAVSVTLVVGPRRGMQYQPGTKGSERTADCLWGKLRRSPKFKAGHLPQDRDC